jgi:hypothetical protein
MNGASAFVRIPRALLEAPDIKAPEFAVLVALYSYADSEGKCWPSLASIARRAHLDRSTVKRILSVFETDAYLSRSKRFEEESREPTSTLYVLDESRLGRRSERLGRRGPPLPEVGAQSAKVGAERALGRRRARPELIIELREENTSEILEEKDEKPKDNLPTSSPFSDPSPPCAARPPLPGSSEPAPRKQKGNKVPPELLPVYHEIEAKLQEAAKERGITWLHGKEGAALGKLVKAYETHSEDLGPLVETWISLTDSGNRFFKDKAPTASMLFSLLSSVEAEHGKHRLKASPSALPVCPVCESRVPQGGQYCPTCKTMTEDFANPKAVAEAKSRREALV